MNFYHIKSNTLYHPEQIYCICCTKNSKFRFCDSSIVIKLLIFWTLLSVNWVQLNRLLPEDGSKVYSRNVAIYKNVTMHNIQKSGTLIKKIFCFTFQITE